MRLRWRLSKILNKTMNDPVFETITSTQWMLYAELFRLDEQEKVEEIRDYLEYLARFWDNKAVDQVQESRKHAKKTDDSDFNKILKAKFGKGLEDSGPPQLSIDELGQQIRGAAEQQE